MQHVHFPDFGGINTKPCRHQIDGVFQRKNALGCAISPIGSRTGMIAVNGICHKPEGFIFAAIKRNGFMSCQTDSRRTMFSICTGIGQYVHFNRPDGTVLHSAQLYLHAHFMTGTACNHGFFTGIVDFTRLAGEPGDNSWEPFHHRSLLGAKAAADTGFDDTNLAFRDSQCGCHISAHMEGNLCGALNDQSAKGIHPAVCGKGFHHRLLIFTRMIGFLQYLIAFRKNRVHIPHMNILMIDGIALVVAMAPIALRPVLLRMDENFIVQ